MTTKSLLSKLGIKGDTAVFGLHGIGFKDPLLSLHFSGDDIILSERNNRSFKMYPDWSNGQVYTFTSHKSGILGYFCVQSTMRIVAPPVDPLRQNLIRGVDVSVCTGIPFFWLFSMPILLTLEKMAII